MLGTTDLPRLYEVRPLRLEDDDATALKSQIVVLASPDEPVPEPPRRPKVNFLKQGKGRNRAVGKA